MSYFYSHLVKVDDVVLALEELELTNSQKHHLSKLADSTVHHVVLDLILSQLSSEDKIKFVKMVEEDPRDQGIMEFLSSKIEKIEEQIEKIAEDLHTELHADIKETQRRVKKNG